MAQHDYVIANGTGAAVRSDLNNGLSAIVTQNSGATEPATTYAFMRWADTTAGVMKMRNSANNAWITLYQLDGEWTNIAFENGTAAAPSIYFKDSGTDTGFYSPGANQVGISTGGTAALVIDSSQRLLVGTSSTSANTRVVVKGNSFGGNGRIDIDCDAATPASGDGLGYIVFGDSTQSTGAYVGAERDGGTWSGSSKPSRLVFYTAADGASIPATRMTITNGGNVLIANNAADNNYFQIQGSAGELTFYPPRTGDEFGELATDPGSGLDFSTNGGTLAMRINTAQEVLVGYTVDNGAYKLQVNSQIFATSATIATSDGRYKENVTTLCGCLDLVKALRPVSFTWKPQNDITRMDENGNEVLVREAHNFPEGAQVGFIAQEVQEVLVDKPWLGSVIKENTRPAVKDSEGNELAPEEQFFGIAEGNLIAVLTNALQEAIERIEALEIKVAALEAS